MKRFLDKPKEEAVSQVLRSQLTSEEKKLVVLLKEFFDRNRKEFNFRDSSTQMVADALELGLSTVDRVMSSYRKDPKSLKSPPKSRGRPEHSIDVSHQETIRSLIRTANLEGKRITLEILKDLLQERSKEIDEFHLSTLARALDRWGFEFGKGTRTQHLKEKDYTDRGHNLRFSIIIHSAFCNILTSTL